MRFLNYVMMAASLASGAVLATGQGDVCIHISSRLTGPDTVAVGQYNRLEVWIANDDFVTGMSLGFEVTCSTEITWLLWDNWLPVLTEHGRAVGVWDLTEPPLTRVVSVFDGVSPEHFNLSGAALGDGLPPGPSELCYSLRFEIPAGVSEYEEGFCIDPYFFPPAGSWMFDDSGPPYPPDFCGQPTIDEDDPQADPACFPIMQPQYLCGDADGSGFVNVSDAIYIYYYIFRDGPEPYPHFVGDVDCNWILNISDVVYLLTYIFAGGPEPCAGCP